jgi:hydrogenase/urease accessory protein HupE
VNTTTRRGAFIALCVALCTVPQAAAAHGSVQGLGNFFSGVVHPLFEPAQLIALVALGLLIGQRGLSATRPAALCFVLGALLGLLAAMFGAAPAIDSFLLAGAGLIGLAVLTATPLPRALCAVVAAGVGLAVGLGSGPEAATGSARVVMLLGTAVGVCVWMFNVVGLVHEAKRPWLRIGVRVVGSWITATAVLMTALWFAPSRSATPPLAQALEGKASVPLTLNVAR